MKDLDSNFFKPDELVIDLVFGTLRATKLCLELLRYRYFVGYKGDSICFTAIKEAVVETYGRQILTKKPSVSGSDEIVDAIT